MKAQPIRGQYSKYQPITMEETTLDTFVIVHEVSIGFVLLVVVRAVCGGRFSEGFDEKLGHFVQFFS